MTSRIRKYVLLRKLRNSQLLSMGHRKRFRDRSPQLKL